MTARQKKSLPRNIWESLNHQVLGGLIVAGVVALASAIWAIMTATSGGNPVSPSPVSVGSRSAQGFTAHVAWTDDGGGGSTSTTLYSYAGPTSHVHAGAYPLGESLTVVCQTPRGRAIQVGPDYKGPSPDSTTWYRLDNGAWVPAVYTRVDRRKAVPTCQ